jgi:hypothetical protein
MCLYLGDSSLFWREREREISVGGEELCRCGADSEAVKINCLSRYKPIYIGHVGLD